MLMRFVGIKMYDEPVVKLTEAYVPAGPLLPVTDHSPFGHVEISKER